MKAITATLYIGAFIALFLSGAGTAWAQAVNDETPSDATRAVDNTMPEQETLNWDKFMGEDSPFTKIARGMIIEKYKTDPAFRIEMYDAARAQHHSGDGKRAIAIFTDLAEHAKHTPSMRWLARMAYRGEAQEGDKALAYDWMNKAALAGDVEAMVQIGGVAFEGDGMTQSYVTARHWFLYAADRGSNKADAKLFQMFRDGLGGEADKKMAMVFAKRLAGSFKPDGLYYMGVAYREGDGIAQDFEEAKISLELAMEEGHPEAEAALEKLFSMEASAKNEGNSTE